jgi:hypothetical protein
MTLKEWEGKFKIACGKSIPVPPLPLPVTEGEKVTIAIVVMESECALRHSPWVTAVT